MDILYNVIARPVANEAERKGGYYVDPAQKDSQAKKIKDDDPSSNQQQSKHKEEETAEQGEELDKKLQPKKEGKGLYEDSSGQKRLDIYA